MNATNDSQRAATGGFTLIELLVVIAILAILAAIVYPMLSEAKQRTLQVECASNMAQAMQAIIRYADDYDGRLPGLRVFGDLVDGRYAWSHKDFSTIGKGALWKYVRTKQVFICPVDLQHRRPGDPNNFSKLGGFNYTYTWNSYMTRVQEGRGLAEVSGPPITKSRNPSRSIILVDENTDPEKNVTTVNDCHFASGDVTCDRHPAGRVAHRRPTKGAESSANVAYLDGHTGAVPGLLGYGEQPDGAAIFWR